ncbi:hypothetical protein AN931_23095 [Mycobacterium intracellulare subsp. chimaera]|nr:hypothetical protein AN931_23095 [Mycobacterium intracellulare subsp. chimaera]KPN48994.1 hypothetical protein AN933_22745 [Mycobacterium intracellulare subsp. chimaera]
MAQRVGVSGVVVPLKQTWSSSETRGEAKFEILSGISTVGSCLFLRILAGKRVDVDGDGVIEEQAGISE